MNSELLQGFYLGDLLLEPLKGQVSGRFGSRHLPPKAVEVLLCLASEPGELVTREALLEAVWGSGHGSSESLGHAISEIRHALDDHSGDPHFIQTLPRRGYRLAVAPVLVSENTASIVLGADNRIDVRNIGFFENLQRRGVIETALAYLIVGWLLIQIADIVFAQLHLPEWTGTFVTVFVIAGFPIAIILSWFLEFRDGKAILHELSPAHARRRRFSRTYLSVVGALASAALLVYVYDSYIGLPERAAVPSPTSMTVLAIDDNSIAVLPFLNVDGSDETQTFANGLVDDVITRLSRVPGLLVSSRGDSHSLEPNSRSELVRQRLRVAMYLEGSVHIAGDKIRVITQLIDSATGFHILSRTFDRPREDFFAIRDELTNLTVSTLRPALPADTQELGVTSAHNPSLDAYVLFRRGLDESRKPQSATTIANALDWFDDAIGIDPEYAAAFAGRCSVIADAYSLTGDPDSVPRAEAACSKALELNPNLDIVHTALGNMYALTGDYQNSESAYTKALDINPRNVLAMTGLADVYRRDRRAEDAENLLRSAIGLQPGNWAPYNSLGFFLYRQGRYDEAALYFSQVVDLDRDNMRGYGNLGASYMMAGDFAAATPVFERAIDIDPQHDMYSNLGLVHYYLGQYEEAAAALRSAIELSPKAHLTWSNLGDVLTAYGRHDEAREAFATAGTFAEQALDVNPNDAPILMDVAWIHAMLGDRVAAFTAIEKALQLAPEDPYADYIFGLINNHFGETDAALAALESAVSKGYSRVIIAAEPHLRGLHDSRRFDAIVTLVK